MLAVTASPMKDRRKPQSRLKPSPTYRHQQSSLSSRISTTMLLLVSLMRRSLNRLVLLRGKVAYYNHRGLPNLACLYCHHRGQRRFRV